jgi:hypothetical protein
MNLGLFCFNLFVPAYPLDGGRLLADGLLLAGLPAAKAAWVTVSLARCPLLAALPGATAAAAVASAVTAHCIAGLTVSALPA